MDLTNSTDQDTKWKVSGTGGGSGVGPPHHFRVEEAAGWPTLRAGARIHHDPTPPGPWVVCFFVGNHQVVKEISSASDHVQLLQDGATFRAHVA